MKEPVHKDQHGNVLINPYQCRICGQFESAKRWAHIHLPEQGICFGCHFWRGHAGNAADPASVRIDGHHYWIGAEDAGEFRGFGGRPFPIHFKDGRRVRTTNLWSQGEIPAVWRKVLPDNAVWGDTPDRRWVTVGGMSWLSDGE
jgi:hypothetical protein